LIVLLLAATAVSFAIGDRIEAAAIAAIVVLDVVLGFVHRGSDGGGFQLPWHRLRSPRRDAALPHLPSARGLNLRVGIDSGPFVAGVIGRTKFGYDLWGDTVNTASRMESHAPDGAIQVTEQTYRLLSEDFEFERRPGVSVKGKGQMTTYLLLTERKRPTRASNLPARPNPSGQSSRAKRAFR
jgi:hypothetical protein